METKVGDENGLITKTKRHPGKKLNYQMVWEAVQAFTIYAITQIKMKLKIQVISH